MADELTRALGLLAAHGVLQLTQSAAKAEPQQVAVNLHFASQVGGLSLDVLSIFCLCLGVGR